MRSSPILRLLVLFFLIAIHCAGIAQAPTDEAKFLKEYQQYVLRAQNVATKINSVIGGMDRGNDQAALAATREIANLREEIADMLNQAMKSNLARQSSGLLESRRLLYLTEAGNTLMSELGIMFILPRRNELPLLRTLDRYREVRKILEFELQQ